MELKIELAKIDNLDEIMKIYTSLIGFPGCTWDEDYPNEQIIKDNILKNSLYIVYYQNVIIAVAYAGKDEDFNLLNQWNKEISNPCLLARVAVLKEFQGKGIAKKLLNYIEIEVSNHGFNGIHLLVSKSNQQALSLYNSLNFQCCGEAFICDLDWYCYEKAL